MLIATLKRRWPVATAIIAALAYVINNYDIRGLEGLRLEPKASQAGAESPFGFGRSGSNVPGAANTGIGWQTSFPSGPRLPSPGVSGYAPGPVGPAGLPGLTSTSGLPSTLPSTSGLPGTGAGGSHPGAVPLSPVATSGDWQQMLSPGEKLGMLDAQAQPTQGIAAAAQSSGRSVADGRETIRIASFNLHGFGDVQQSDAAIVGVITRLLSQFDLIALQDIRSRRDDVLPNLVSSLNAGGGKYDFMIGPRVGRGDQREQFAFVFDTQRIETDRFQLYTVEDPEDMLHHEPLVGWFRTIGPANQDAFTFSLVNVHLDPDLVERELQALPNLLQAIAADGRGEDDIVLAGDFHASAAQLGFLSAGGLRVALDGVATNTRGTELLDNFAFGALSTTEYTGRTGAYDFLRQFNLSLEQAEAVSDHLPIWAEFSIIEGGRPGQVAENVLPVQRFQSDYH
ncbi:MAG: hypothetical protein ACTHK7_05745 [Aureliella sp.]